MILIRLPEGNSLTHQTDGQPLLYKTSKSNTN
jgi:hypothetical protein